MAFVVDKKKIAKNTFALYGRMAITMLISFFTTRVMLQQLGADDYGLNNLVAGVVSLFSFLNGSMGTAVQRFFSIEIGKNNEQGLKRIFSTGLFLHIIVAIISVILAEIFAIFFLYKLNIPEERHFAAQVVFQMSIFQMVLNIINVPYAALLRAREMFSKTAVIEIIQAFLRLGVLFLLVHINYDKLITLSFLNVGITFFYVTSLFILARKFNESHVWPKYDNELAKEMLAFISMLIVTVLAQLCKTQGIIILINMFFGLAINAAYAVAVQVSGAVNSFVLNFKQSMVPQMMSAYGAGDKATMHKLINTGTKITSILLLIVTLPIIFEREWILSLWLGTPPQYAADLVALVLIQINISSFTFFHYQGVHATGKILGQQIWVSSLFIANILIIYIVFRLGGDFRSALYVNMMIGFFQCIVNLVYARETYNYNIRDFVLGIMFPILGLTLVVIVGSLLIVIVFESSTWRFFLIFGFCLFMISIIGYFWVLTIDERKQVRRLFHIGKC